MMLDHFCIIMRTLIFTRSTPLSRLTVKGVGFLIDIGAKRGRTTRPDIKLGHLRRAWWRPSGSIYFFEEVGLDYVSCSPYRVPAARDWQRRKQQSKVQFNHPCYKEDLPYLAVMHKKS